MKIMLTLDDGTVKTGTVLRTDLVEETPGLFNAGEMLLQISLAPDQPPDKCCGKCVAFRNNECHHSPPSRLPRKFAETSHAGNRIRNEDLLWGWPKVQPGDWCYEYISKWPA